MHPRDVLACTIAALVLCGCTNLADLEGLRFVDGDDAPSGSSGSGIPGTIVPPTDVRFGAPELLVDGLQTPAEIASDGQSLYWLTPLAGNGGQIWTLPLDGGDALLFAQDDNDPLAGLVLHGAFVYWFEASPDGCDKDVYRMEKANAGVDAWYNLRRSCFEPIGLYASGNRLYYATREEPEAIFWLAEDGSDAVMVLELGALARPIVADAGAIYYYMARDRALRVTDSAGSQSTTLVVGVDIVALAVRDEVLFWLEADGDVMRMAVDEQQPTLLASEGAPRDALVLDDSHAYWIAADTVWSVPLGGGDVATLASGEPSAIAVDDEAVYLSEVSEGAIWRVGKQAQ